MKEKVFKIPRDQLVPDLAPRRGACYATDMITVDGHPVGFMCREEPSNDVDGGWRFFSGKESQEYVDDADNLALYDVNTIANCDRAIIPFLDAPIGSAFERSADGGFVVVEFSPSED